jgi:O-antigen ligase
MIFFDKRFFVVFLVGVVLVGAFVPQVTTRFTQLFSPTYLEKSTNDGRIARWSNAYDQMRTSPVFGVGLGHYGGAVGARNFGTTYVDSYVFKTVAETGLLGLGLFGWLIVAIFRGIHRYWRSLRAVDMSKYYTVGGVYAGLLAVMFHNGVENIFEMPFMNLFWWLLAGALLALNPASWAKGGNEANE